MKRILLALFFLSLSAVAFAQSITIDFGDAGDPVTLVPTANQALKIQAITDDYNKSKGCDIVAKTCPNGTTLQTRAGWLKIILTDAVKNWTQQVAERDAKLACENYQKANTATKNQIDTALGGKSPCP